MEALLKQMAPDAKEGAKNYISKKEIPQLFECITTGLLHHRPENAVLFVQECIEEIKTKPEGAVRWNTFIDWKPSENAMKSPPPSREGSVRKLLHSSLSERPKSSMTPFPTLGTDTDTAESTTSGSTAVHGRSQKVQIASAESLRAPQSAAVDSFP